MTERLPPLAEALENVANAYIARGALPADVASVLIAEGVSMLTQALGANTAADLLVRVAGTVRSQS